MCTQPLLGAVRKPSGRLPHQTVIELYSGAMLEIHEAEIFSCGRRSCDAAPLSRFPGFPLYPNTGRQGFCFVSDRQFDSAGAVDHMRESREPHDRERLLRGIIKQASALILICTPSGQIECQTGAAASLIGRKLSDLVHPDDQPGLSSFWSRLRSAPNTTVNETIRITFPICAEAETRGMTHLIATNLVHDPIVKGIVVSLRTASDNRTLVQPAAQSAFYDALTGLPNRALFHDRLEQALLRSSRQKFSVGVLIVSLDSLGPVSDRLGQDVGEKLLIEAAGRLRTCVRAEDTVARLESDEFALVLEMLNGYDDTLPVARAITEQFRRPLQLGHDEFVLTASIGIALTDARYSDAGSVVSNAGLALRQAKIEGHGRHLFFNENMIAHSQSQRDLERDLREAIEKDELDIHYQPIVDIVSGEIVEVEALARWHHPTRGLVAPVDFIAIAEETDLVVHLGKWVLHKACLQLAEWHRVFPSVPSLMLSINLSAYQFQKPFLAADVIEALLEADLTASCLRLGVSEAGITRDIEATSRTLWELKELGLRIAIDNFGTGTSSLSQLRRLPLDVLKIDRSLISRIGDDEEADEVVRGIIALARSLALRITGEGIETARQAALLRAWGSNEGQGYYFGKPLDSRQTAELISKSSKSIVAE